MKRWLTAALVLLSLLPSQPVRAVVTACSASVSPTTVTRSTTRDFTFTINNTDSVIYRWIRISRPNTNFTINSISVSGWGETTTSAQTTLTAGTLAAGGTLTVTLNVTSGSSDAPSANWTVEASDDAGGASPFSCTGTLGVSISGAPPDTTAPVISNVTATDISGGSAKITWNTDENADSQVDYGLTEDLGSSVSDSGLVTSHQMGLTGLSGSTTYYYQVLSKDAAGNLNNSATNTFTTAKPYVADATAASSTSAPAPAATQESATQAKTTPAPAATQPAPQAKVTTRTPSPQATLTTNLSKPFKTAPKISGRATASAAIVGVDYSTDDGRNWLPVDRLSRSGATATYEFTPKLVEDGNYPIRVRVKDAAGTVGVSEPTVLVIDRLPPSVGGNLVSVGSHLLGVSADGILVSLARLNQQITLNAVGGPTSIDITTGTQVFSLVQDPDTGLWSGTMSFDKPGVYQLSAKSIDGAKNVTEQKLNTVVVISSGHISAQGKPVADATVTLWQFNPTNQRFARWDGRAFGQDNPQPVKREGSYQLLVPPGRYYLEVKAPGFKTLKSNIFSLTESLPVNPDFTLEPAPSLKIGPFRISLPYRILKVSGITISYPIIPDEARQRAHFEPRELSAFSLPADGETISNDSLKGKPAIISFLTSWLPQSAEQLRELDRLAKRKDLNVVAVMALEPKATALSFKQRGGYGLPVVADPDGVFSHSFNLNALPLHLMVDAHGVVKRKSTGLLTAVELLDQVVGEAR